MHRFPRTLLEGIHVLVVDDNDDARNVLDSYLRHYGAIVTIARDGAEALGMLDQVAAHVIISDLAMPGLDGGEFMERVRAMPAQKRRRTPSIAVTAFPDRFAERLAHSKGFDMYYPKPVDPLDIVEAVSILARGEARKDLAKDA